LPIGYQQQGYCQARGPFGRVVLQRNLVYCPGIPRRDIEEHIVDLSAIGFVDTETPQHIIFIRLLIAALIGGIIGYEREAHHENAGLRTHILIATASCLFTLLAIEIQITALATGSNNPDPIRAVEAVTAGVAFLGAGAIFQQRGNVRGLTTGAGMWLAGALGVAVALGYYFIALALAVFALIVLAALRHFSHRVVRGNGNGNETNKN
jgi:putative Mg2+ transporter-C (MgtC) family protein